jgi:hypothetical protein
MYPSRARANTFGRTDEKGKRKEYHSDDPGGKGQEVAREVLVCSACAAQWNGQR